MEPAPSRLQLLPGKWYGWQMLPGYLDTPYFSPIRIETVVPKKTGRKILAVQFFDALYAQGVQDVALDLRILKHEARYLVAELMYGDFNRAGIVYDIDFEWVRRFCPEILVACPPSEPISDANVAEYLEAIRW